MNENIKELIGVTYSSISLPIYSIINQTKRRKVEAFKNNMAVDFYNLHNEPEEIKEFSEKYCILNASIPENIRMNEAKIFLGGMVSASEDKYIASFGQPIKSDVKTTGELEVIGLVRFEQTQFKAIVNKIINNKELAGHEKKYIASNLYGEITEIFDNKRRIIGVISMGILRRMLYEFIICLSRGEVEANFCASMTCNRLFTQAGGGSIQLYCSRACKMRAYRYRKKIIKT